MQLIVAAVGRLKQGPERELAAHYAARIDAAGPGVSLGPMSVIELAEGRGATADLRKSDEALRLIAALAKIETVVALDETGKAQTSRQFAEFIRTQRDGGCSRLAFVIGGPDGQGLPLRQRAARVLSLGPMTLPHGLARLIVLEQIYRAVTILSGHPYHRD